MIRKIKASAFFCSLVLVFVGSIYLLTKTFLICGIVTISLVLLVVFAKYLFLIVNKQLRQTNWYKNQFIDSGKFLKKIPHNLDICNLGSNSGKFAFTYEDTSVKGENWAVGPQSLSYDFRVLKSYFSFLKDGCNVLITIAPFVCCLKDYTDDKANAKYYPFLNPVLIVNYSRRKQIQYVRYPNFSTPKAIRYLIHDVKADNRLSLSTNPMTPEEIEQDAMKWINGWKQQFSIIDMDTNMVSEENQRAIEFNTILLSKMIDFCIVRDLKPVIVLPPITQALSAKFSETFRELYIYSFIRNANTRKVPVLDYFDDERFMDTDLYFNSFFLNSKGRKIFTDVVLNDIFDIKTGNRKE